jgi:hypothetical protein
MNKFKVGDRVVYYTASGQRYKFIVSCINNTNDLVKVKNPITEETYEFHSTHLRRLKSPKPLMMIHIHRHLLDNSSFLFHIDHRGTHIKGHRNDPVVWIGPLKNDEAVVASSNSSK